MGVAFEISLLFSVEAEVLHCFISTFGFGGHLSPILNSCRLCTVFKSVLSYFWI